jgi:tRNA threonylcarbamoyladenosine biosynthesis protein TsaE
VERVSGAAGAAVAPADGSGVLVATTDSADQTRRLAGAVARLCEPGDVILLAGGLGAGKTTFAQGFGVALGIDVPITSPTFVLVREYALAGRKGLRVLFHADVYRLDHLGEIVDLGLGELVEEGGVALVEWGDAAAPILGSGALLVRLISDESDEDDDHRAIELRSVDDAWSRRWKGLAAALGPWGVTR